MKRLINAVLLLIFIIQILNCILNTKFILAKQRKIVDPIVNQPFTIKWDSSFFHLPNHHNKNSSGHALIKLIIDENKRVISYNISRYSIIIDNDTLRCKTGCDSLFIDMYGPFINMALHHLIIYNNTFIDTSINRTWGYQIKINFR
jgi:hypothetical protein